MAFGTMSSYSILNPCDLFPVLPLQVCYISSGTHCNLKIVLQDLHYRLSYRQKILIDWRWDARYFEWINRFQSYVLVHNCLFSRVPCNFFYQYFRIALYISTCTIFKLTWKTIIIIIKDSKKSEKQQQQQLSQ